MRSTKIRKDRVKNSSRGAQLCSCSIDTVHSYARAQSIRCTVVLVLNRYGAQLYSCSMDTVHSCTRAQSIRCPISLVCNWIVLSRWYTVNFVLNSLVPTCSKNGVCNRSGAHLYLCMTELCSCTIDSVHKWPVRNFPYRHCVQWVWCTIVSVCNWTVPNRSCTIDATIDNERLVGAQLYPRIACPVDMVYSYSRTQSVHAQLVVLNRYRAHSYGARSVPSRNSSHLAEVATDGVLTFGFLFLNFIDFL